MNSKGKILSFLVILGIIILFSDAGMSLIIVGGGEPIEDRGWPSGCAEMANLATRFGWWEGPPFGGGEYHFLYRCEKTEQFNQALERFAAIDAKRLELVLHNGPKKDYVVDGPVHWTFLAWVPKNWDSLHNNSRNFYRLADSGSTKPVPMAKKTMPVPRVDVYLGGANPIIWKDVKVPQNLAVIERRPGSVAPQFAGKGLVRGKVLDLETKRPIAGASVVLLERVQRTDVDTGESARTGSSGDEWETVKQAATETRGLCQIDQIPLGVYEVSVTAQGYASVELERYDNRRAECYEFEAGLLRPFSITGIVTDAQGTPLRDVGVQAGDFIGPDGREYGHQADSPVLTDAQGRFEIPGLPKGFASLRCRAEGLHQADSIFEMYPVPSKGIKLTMTGTGIIRGKVVDRDGKVPSGQIHIHIRPPGEQIGKWGGSARCKEDGSFEFAGVPPGEYLVGTDTALLIEGDRTNAKLVTVEAGKTYDIEIVHVKQRRRR
jgi:hypothetical protein